MCAGCEEGVDVFLGSAANPVILERVALDRAQILILALADPLAARQAADYVRFRYPEVDIVARTHSDAEARFLDGRGVSAAVMGERELALEITRHTLRRFGVSAAETTAIVQGLRTRRVVEEDGPLVERAT